MIYLYNRLMGKVEVLIIKLLQSDNGVISAFVIVLAPAHIPASITHVDSNVTMHVNPGAKNGGSVKTG